MRSSVTNGSATASLVTDFKHAASAVGTRVITVSAADLADLLAAYGSDSSSSSIGYSTDLERALGRPASVGAMARPETLVSRARLAVASTGTVLVAERLAQDRVAALLCTRHVVVLPVDRIVPTLYQTSEPVRSLVAADLGYVTFITGPSRTSDIEKVLTLGAHGPAELEVILVDCWEPRDD